MEKGKLKKSKIIIGKREISVPKEFIYDREEYKNVECEFEGENNKLTKITVIIDGHRIDIPIDSQIEQKKEEANERIKAEKEAQRQADIAIKQKDKQVPQQSSWSDPKVLPDSFDVQKAQVPKDVQGLPNFKDMDNFNLKFNKFARFDTDEKGKENFFFSNPQDRKDRDKTIVLPKFKIKPNFGNFDFDNLNKRQIANAENLLGNNLLQKSIFKPDWRLVIGLGGASVYETAMTLHHIYGVPFIPASSIKGVLRSYIIKQPPFNNKEELAIDDKEFCDLFGCPANIVVDGKPYKSHYKEARGGTIVIFDAFPTQKPTIQVDIMNPHYPDWYGSGKPPTDTQSPNPIMFLVVEYTPFQFLLGGQIQTFRNELLSDLLKAALSESGIGAKTAVGYGYMAS